MNKILSILCLVLGVIPLHGQQQKQQQQTKKSIVEQDIIYDVDGKKFKGYMAYDANMKDKRPAIIVVHEWWGLNDYIKGRVKQLVDLGYLAMAVDMFGDRKIAANPKEAMALAKPYYDKPELTRKHIDEVIKKLKSNDMVDNSKIAAMGYCFGGYVVLNAAKAGSDLIGVVSFHGNLTGAPPDKLFMKTKDILVCHGLEDKFVSPKEVSYFNFQMDSAKVHYTFKTYPDATHAFTNPESTKNGKQFDMPIEYNEQADKDSWNDMKGFFDNLFKNSKK